MAFGFMKIFKRKEKAKQSLLNVTQRIKARLLVQTRNLYCGQDIMKSYLKWMLKSKPDFLKESISKIPLYGKINHQVAFWRMKKLVTKPIVKKLSDSAKALRRLRGFYNLHLFMQYKRFLEAYNFLNKLNPHRGSMYTEKIKKIFQRMCDGNNDRMRDAFRALRRNKDLAKDIIQRLIDRHTNRLRAAFWILRMKNRSEK